MPHLREAHQKKKLKCIIEKILQPTLSGEVFSGNLRMHIKRSQKKGNWTPMLEMKNPKKSQLLLSGKSGMALNTK